MNQSRRDYIDYDHEANMMVGRITLPDGRQVWAQVSPANDYENPEIEWPDGTPLTAAEYDLDLDGMYLHEYVSDKLARG